MLVGELIPGFHLVDLEVTSGAATSYVQVGRDRTGSGELCSSQSAGSTLWKK